ncbi:MAG: FKBP-type peptidyl-prolyl cis-trans isomerase, partial [Sediminibacterium sp.]|nr:FKBP-type peptidyl-prolyl cis-trans isomerase [Sediminibacterium sp.]
LLMLVLNGCSKSTDTSTNTTNCTNISFEKELDTMISFCKLKNIKYTQHPKGFLYQIIDTGVGNFITISNRISVVYTGTYLNSVTFDATANPIFFSLSEVIVGWQECLQLIRNKGRIKVVLPSSLSYGCNGRGSIPPNTPLYFDITISNILN